MKPPDRLPSAETEKGGKPLQCLEYAQEVIRQRGEIDESKGEVDGDLRQAVSVLLPDGQAQEFVGRRVEEIIAQVIESGANTIRTPQGHVGVAYSRAHPTYEQHREIFTLGPSAIAALADYAWSGPGFESYAATRLLAGLGGAELLGPFSRIALEHSDPFRRYSALNRIVEGTCYLRISRLLLDLASEERSPSARFARQVLQAIRPASGG